MRARQPLVVFAPFPPMRSGIADYVAELMPYHLQEFDVTLVVANDAPVADQPAVRTLLASEFRRHRAYFENVPKLYHFGNNPQHCYLLDLILQDPGIVVLHDFNLGYLHEMATLKWGNRQGYLRAIEREYGRLGGDIVRWQFEKEFREVFASYALPLNGGVLESATAIIVHSLQVQYKVAARVPGIPVWHVPHHLSPTVQAYLRASRLAARKRMGLPADELIVTAIGFVTRAKQIPLTLAALGTIRDQVPPFRFVLGGERRPDEYDVDADIARSGLSGLTTCTDYLSEREFFDLLLATDILVNLRYPSGGEMSGTLVRALGMGVPTIVLDYGPIGELPDRAVRKIPWSNDVEQSLATTLREMMTDPDARTSLGASAAAYVRSVHDIERVAQTYSRIIREWGRSPAVELAPCEYELSSGSAAKLIQDAAAHDEGVASSADSCLWWRAGAVPLGAANEGALVLADHSLESADLLSRVFNWEKAAISTMSVAEFLAPRLRAADGSSISAGSFAFALVISSGRLDEREAALLLRRLNVALKRRAALILEFRSNDNQSTRPDPVFGEDEIAQRLTDAGFDGVHFISPQDGILAELILPRAETANARRTTCVTARKASDYFIWRFVTQAEGVPMRWGGRTGGYAAAGGLPAPETENSDKATTAGG